MFCVFMNTLALPKGFLDIKYDCSSSYNMRSKDIQSHLDCPLPQLPDIVVSNYTRRRNSCRNCRRNLSNHRSSPHSLSSIRNNSDEGTHQREIPAMSSSVLIHPAFRDMNHEEPSMVGLSVSQESSTSSTSCSTDDAQYSLTQIQIGNNLRKIADNFRSSHKKTSWMPREFYSVNMTVEKEALYATVVFFIAFNTFIRIKG